MEPWQFELAHPDLVKIGTISFTKLSLGFSPAVAASAAESTTSDTRDIIGNSPPLLPFSPRSAAKQRRQRAGGTISPPSRRPRSRAVQPDWLPVRARCFQIL